MIETVDPVIHGIVNICLSLLFLGAGLQKLVNRHQFSTILKQYALLPGFLVKPAAVMIPVLEIIVSLGLLAPETHKLAAAWVICLLLGYAVAMSINVRRGNVAIDCGCSFGTAKQTVSMALVWRNSLLAALAIVLLAPLSERSIEYFDYGVMVFGIVQFSLLYLIGNTLLAQQAVTRELMS